MICLHLDQFPYKVLGVWWIHSSWKLLLSFIAACSFSRMQLLFLSLTRVPRVFDVVFYYQHCLCFLLTSFFSLFSYLSFKFYFINSSALLRNLSDFCFLKMCWHLSSSLICFLLPFNVILARYSKGEKINACGLSATSTDEKERGKSVVSPNRSSFRHSVKIASFGLD